MSGQPAIDVAAQRRRLMIMIAIDAVCVVVALVAIVGALGFHVKWMLGLFVLAVLAGFGAQVWLMLGLMKDGPGPKADG